MPEGIALFTVTFLVSLVYSSIGHGGASGYLALLAFLAVPPSQMSGSALSLNLLVSLVAFWVFFKAGHFSWPLTWPFIATSVPCAFVGGLLEVSRATYSILLGGVLIFAAWRLLVHGKVSQEKRAIPLPLSFSIGAVIGILSGIVGVGGGIFLSPILLLFSWADPKKVAGTSAFFILANSSAGLLGRLATNALSFTPVLIYMIVTAFVGGLMGSRLGANHFSAQTLRIILAGVLLLASVKLLTAGL